MRPPNDLTGRTVEFQPQVGPDKLPVQRVPEDKGIGLWGLPTGHDILISAVSHYRLRGGSIIEDVTVFDELAVLRQVSGGLAA